MKALLDTNIIIHRETPNVRNLSIGTLFKWLDKANFTKCVHSVTIEELNKNYNAETKRSFNAKIQACFLCQIIANLLFSTRVSEIHFPEFVRNAYQYYPPKCYQSNNGLLNYLFKKQLPHTVLNFHFFFEII
mgnify:CR=1 FL=1